MNNVCLLLLKKKGAFIFVLVLAGTWWQDVIELDRDDEQSGRMQEIHQHLLDAYSQTPPGEGSSRGGSQVPIELIMEDPAQEASESSQELCDTVQEVSEAHDHDHIVEDKAHSV